MTMQKNQYQIYPGEYNNYVRHPLSKLLYDVTAAGIGPGNISPLANIPAIANGDGAGSAALHHGAFIGQDGFAYAVGDVNILGRSALSGVIKTPVGNAKQVLAYANSGDNNGNGIAVVTNSGKIILLGNTQSGFRGDGTAGSIFEPVPYTVSLPVATTKVAAASYFYALGSDGKVYRWGGSIQDSYRSQFCCGSFSAKPNLLSIGTVNLPESIVDIMGGAEVTYAVGASGEVYAWGYDGNYWMMPSASQTLQYFKIRALLPKGNIVQLALASQASYCLMDTGEAYSWGDNTQGLIGNGKEASFPNFVAPWNGGSLWQSTPYRIQDNPAVGNGVSFVKIFAGLGDSFYIFMEDANGNLRSWGRNKGFVLWNGQGGDSTTQSIQPNKWDITSPMKIVGFGSLPVIPSPPPSPCPTIVKVNTAITWSDGSVTNY